MNRRVPTQESNSKWGYAVAGAIALGFAAVIQLAFDGLDESTLANMPAVIAIPYGVAGKLGITVPLALLGLGLIGRDLVGNHGKPDSCVPAKRRRSKAAVDDEELEIGEPILDEPAPVAGGKNKIAALAGGFAAAGPKADGPVARSNAAEGGGCQMVLASAKYLNANPGRGAAGGFRKGGTKNTASDE